MQEKITALTRDIHIHQDVEKELAKRSHYSQKIIKRMKDRIQDLEWRLKQSNSSENTPKLNLDNLQPLPAHEIGSGRLGITPNRYRGRKNGQSMSVLGSVGPSSRRSPLKSQSIAKPNQNESLIQFLENKLEHAEN